MKKNIFSEFIDRIENFPNWIKQIIFLKLSEDLQISDKEDIFLVYKPILTYKGSEELKNRTGGMDLNIYNFLEYCKSDASISEISLNTFLSPEEVAKYFIFCFEQGYIERPENTDIETIAGYIAGKFRTGEYFEKTGLITQEQLKKAIEISKTSDKKFAQILIDLGFVKKQDVYSILEYKNEANKRFVLDYNAVPKTENCDNIYEKEIADLKLENEKLKKMITQLLEIVKKND